MPATDPVVAVVCADLHLSARPPVARDHEPDWFEAMARPLRVLRRLALDHEVVVLCAGDVFDRWNAPPELINFAIRELPYMWAVPGQHDLPYHDLEQIKRSAFWTLVEADKLGYLEPGHPCVPTRGVCVHGFPHGVPLKSLVPDAARGLHVALAHRYVWAAQYCYEGAPVEHHAHATIKQLHGYDVAVFGDNHKGFAVGGNRSRPWVFNCGTFLRRKSDERDYRPRVGLLHRSGRVSCAPLPTDGESMDVDPRVVELESAADGTQRFLDSLGNMAGHGLDFEDSLRRAVERVRPGPLVRHVLMEALEHGTG